jgi:single-stranded-DNA-specific exonuclease
LDLQRRWLLKNADDGLVSRHVAALKVSPLLARVLSLRGLSDAASARSYLNSSLRADLPPPFIMADMEPAVERIVHAVENHESIAIWADYDVDGTTGASVLVSFFREIGVHPIYHVPHRIDEGYGLNIEGLKRLCARGVGLVITVDCGISNSREVSAAKDFGLDVVIVDHHQPPEDLPAAVAVVNPHRRDCAFPDKGLCAAGLAFYVVMAIRARLRQRGWFKNGSEPDVRRYLDIVALGTIADMVPLRGVNRTLVRRGLLEIAGSARPGLVALKQVANLAAGAVSAGQVSFQLGPRINAAGRVDYGLKVVELLTTESTETAQRIASELDENNRERRALEAKVLAQAAAQAEARINARPCYSLVLAGEGWHPGVLGIVASRIVERFYRPTVVIGIEGPGGKGSARSIRGFHLVEGLRRCGVFLEKFGGHEYAAGLSIAAANIEPFAAAFEQAVRDCLAVDALTPCLEIDGALDFSAIGLPLLRELNSLKPFGIGNPEPLFMSERVQVCERKEFSSGARFRFRQAARVLGGVIFGAADELPGRSGETLDVVYRLAENEWNGTTNVELKLVDAKLSDSAPGALPDARVFPAGLRAPDEEI